MSSRLDRIALPEGEGTPQEPPGPAAPVRPTAAASGRQGLRTRAAGLPSRLWQRGLALLILAAVLGVTAVLIAAPLATVIDPDRGESEQLRRRWVAYETASLSRPALESALKQARSNEAAIAGLLKGNTSALAAAAMQSDVKAIVERNGGEIRSARIVPAIMTDRFERVSVHYDLAISMSALQTLLYQIESHTPYLFVDALDIRMPENWVPAAGGAPEPKLAVRWQLSGYRWGGAP